MKISINKVLMLLISLVFVMGSCKKDEEKECEKNGTGTLKLANNTKYTLNVTNNGVWVAELEAGAKKSITTTPGEHSIVGSGKGGYYYANVEVLQCSNTPANLNP